MSADIPLLALPAGSILQFLCMTLPLLGVYLYFLYLVITRPSLIEKNDIYMEDRIRLTDILYTYMSTLVLFASLIVYLLWFVKKRRKLSKRYESEGIVVLGNVEFREIYEGENYVTTCLEWISNCFRRNDYGYVVYDLEKVARHPACNVEERKAAQLAGSIRKKVRVYYRYPREQVSIMVLPNYPYSGQPKIDLEADWASFSEHVGYPGEEDEGTYGERVALPKTLSRDRSMGVIFIAIFWVAFLFFASMYTCFQIEAIESYYVDESADWAWAIFCVGCILVPLVSFGSNFIRWKLYERWILNSGRKVDRVKIAVSPVKYESSAGTLLGRGSQGSMDEYAEAVSPRYIQMS
ncbi:hypothetical protein ACHAWO_013385 [Cyclotella atomus]|uniref:Uncharacterized protein n=1 Tax=Cyclotella atomus TaxID=382360 RepID=A0ABD3N305_9STRA